MFTTKPFLPGHHLALAQSVRRVLGTGVIYSLKGKCCFPQLPFLLRRSLPLSTGSSLVVWKGPCETVRT